MNQELIIKGKNYSTGTPIVCVPIMAATAEGIVAEAARLVDLGVEMIEWRVDAFEAHSDLSAIREVFAQLRPIMTDTVLLFTYRSKPQGGLGEDSQAVIQEINMTAAECGVADIIDFEYFASDKYVKGIRALQKKGVKVVVSHHDFHETPQPEAIRYLLEEEFESGADIVKLAVMPNTIQDVLNLLSETAYFHNEHPDTPLITMSMGRLGAITRYSGETFGSCVTFGAGSKASAPGQLPQDSLRQILQLIHEAF